MIKKIRLVFLAIVKESLGLGTCEEMPEIIFRSFKSILYSTRGCSLRLNI